MARVDIGVGNWEELAQVARYNATELARLRGCSLRHLEREFRRIFGRAPKVWLKEQRIFAARQMLLRGEQVKRVALDLAYRQTSHFCRQFKSFYKMTPSQFVSARNAERVATPPLRTT